LILPRQRRATDRTATQEYELAEEEVKISLDRFRDEYCSPDGSVK
jgi:DNA-directed RNA polymerase I, II, and III subunit RPABC1